MADDKAEKADDIARVLHALRAKEAQTSEEILQKELTQLLQEFVSPNLRSMRKEFAIRHNLDFPIVLSQGSPILAGGGGVVSKRQIRKFRR